MARAASSSIMAENGVVFVHLAGTIAALRASDGQSLWSSPLGGEFEGVFDNTLYLSTYTTSGCGTGVDYWHEQVYALRTSDGKQRWQFLE